MPNVEKKLNRLAAIQRKVDRLTVDVNVGDYWTVDVNVGDFWAIDVDYGDFWTQHKELASLATGTLQARLVDEFGASLRRIEQSGKLDQPAYLKLQGELEAIIDWLGEVESRSLSL